MTPALLLGALLSFQTGAGQAGADAGVDAGLPSVGAQVTPGTGTGTGTSTDGGSAVPPSSAAAAAPVTPAVAAPVRGRVLGRGTRDPVVAATVFLDGLAAGETGEDGRFTLLVPPGRHRLQVQAPGYDPIDLPIIVPVKDDPQAGGAELLVRLHPRLVGERYETVVAPPAEGSGVALAEDSLLRTAGSLGEPFRVIESLPGVAQVVWPLSLYAVRGANPGNTGFFLDDIRLPALFHFALGPAVIHPYFLEKLDFYPGGYPARYGRFVSGVVAASTAAPKVDRVRGSVDVRLYDAGAIVTTPFNEGRGTVAVAGRYSYTGLLFSKFSPDYTFSYWDYQARVDHQLGGGRLTLFAFGSDDVLGNKAFEDTTAKITFHRLDGRWQGPVGPGRLLLRTSLGFDRSSVSLAPVVPVLIRIRTLSAAPRVSYLIPRDKVDFEVGADAEAQRLRPATERDDADSDLFQERNALVSGAYASLTWRPTGYLQLIPGMRLDVFFQGDRQQVEPGPRLGVRYRPFGDTWLKGHVGRYSQTASLPVAVPGFESFGLGSIGTQSSQQGSLGVEQPFGESLHLDMTAFYQRMRLTDLASVFNYDPSDSRVLELREGESYGVEFMLRRPQRHAFYGWISYTLAWSQRLVGPSQARAWSDWDQRHVLNLVAGQRFRGGYSLGGRLHLNTGRPYPVFDDDNPGPPEYIRLPTFYQLDVRADKRFVFDKYVLDLYIEAVNTTLTKNVFDVKRTMGVVDEKAYRIVLPSVGVHAEW